MKSISTEELAMRWGISRSRILLLAKEGRIEGARRMGRAWVFPADVKKPADQRTTSSRLLPKEEPFRFPLYYFSNYSMQEINTEFSREEWTLYQAEMLFLQQDFEGAYKLLQMLRATALQIPVQSGTLYFFCRTCIQLKKHQEYVEAYEDLKKLLDRDIPYQRELTLLLCDLDTYTAGSGFYSEKFRIDMSYTYHKSIRPYLFVTSAFSDLMAHLSRGAPVSTAPYELVCCMLEEEGYSHAAMILHMYLAAMSMTQNKKGNALLHLRRGITLGIEHQLLSEIAYLYHYIPAIFDSILAEPEMEQAREIPALCNRFYELLQDQIRYMSKTSINVDLSKADFMYIYLAQQGLTNKEVAARLNQSISTVSKHYSALYEMTGAQNKSELIELYMDSLKEYKISSDPQA